MSCSFVFGQFPLTTKIGNVSGNISERDTSTKDTSKSTPKKTKAKYYPLKQNSEKLWNQIDSLNFADSTASEYHWYTINQRSKMPISDLGIPSSPSKELFLKPEFQSLNSGISIHKSNNLTPSNFYFNKVGQPFTEFRYVQGDGLFIGLEALHTQNFSKTWNATINYRTLSNEALYSGSNQDNLSRNLGIGSNFESQNKKYIQQIIFTWNRYKRVENGGNNADSLFYGPPGAQGDGFGLRKFGFYNPSLLSAKSINNYLTHSFKHKYYFDSSYKFSLFQEFIIDRVNYYYSDLTRDSIFYGKEFNYDSLEVNDSSSWNKFSHQLGVGYNLKGIKLNLGYIYEQMTYSYVSNSLLRFENKYINHGIKLDISKKISGWQLFSKNEFYLSGFSKNNYSINVFLDKKIDSTSKIGLTAISNNQNWNIFQSYFKSNHFNFQDNNSRNPMKHTDFGLEYSKIFKNVQLNLTTNGGFIVNPILILEDLQPVNSSSFIYGKLGFDINIKLKSFNLYTNLYFQKYNSKEIDNFGLPLFYSKFGLYYQRNMFSGSLFFKSGFEGFYTSKYQGIQFQPDLPTFSINRQIILGNYPIFDFFVSGQIKTVNIFLKFEHLNEWYIIPNVNERLEDVYKYPIQPFRFRFGFVWKFWN